LEDSDEDDSDKSDPCKSEIKDGGSFSHLEEKAKKLHSQQRIVFGKADFSKLSLREGTQLSKKMVTVLRWDPEKNGLEVNPLDGSVCQTEILFEL
jgi:hypothetical protein